MKMKIEELLSRPSEWVQVEGPNSKIVLSSRVRLARNLRNVPFPGWAKKPERQRALELMQPVVERLSEMARAYSDSMDNVAALDKQVLVELSLLGEFRHVAEVLWYREVAGSFSYRRQREMFFVSQIGRAHV